MLRHHSAQPACTASRLPTSRTGRRGSGFYVRTDHVAEYLAQSLRLPEAHCVQSAAGQRWDRSTTAKQGGSIARCRAFPTASGDRRCITANDASDRPCTAGVFELLVAAIVIVIWHCGVAGEAGYHGGFSVPIQ